jgi:transcriptional regulator with XRE-family HTH domain
VARAPSKPHVLVARNLHALRLRSQMTQEVLAERADVDLRSLQRIEAGAWNMTVDYLARFQKALGCQWQELIEGLDEPLPVATKAVQQRKPVGAKKETHKQKGGKVTSKRGPRRGRPVKPAAKRGRA